MQVAEQALHAVAFGPVVAEQVLPYVAEVVALAVERVPHAVAFGPVVAEQVLPYVVEVAVQVAFACCHPYAVVPVAVEQAQALSLRGGFAPEVPFLCQ